ncbi:MAG: SpoIIE family protein phosphatase [Spirochaetota bacterium]
MSDASLEDNQKNKTNMGDNMYGTNKTKEREKNRSDVNIGTTDINVLKEYKPTIKGDIIAKIASSFYYVEEDQRIEYLAQELTKNENIPAVGVVNKNNQLKGIVVREELFDLLGRPYGRDVYYYRKISTVTRETLCFNYKENIYSIANKLSKQLYDHETYYFLLQTDDNNFAGTFSTKDLLMYLSEITQRDINLATKIQTHIICEGGEHFINNNSEIIGTSTMAKGIGGDFYTIKKYNDTNWAIIICDVSGKGMAASLVTAVISGMLGLYDLNKGLKRFIVALNNQIYNTFQLEKYLTGIFIDFNERTGEMIVYDLGHSHLYLYRNQRFIKLKIKNGNLPIGITPDLSPQANRMKLKKNDLILSFTDGIDEQTNPEGEQYDIKNISKIIGKYKSQDLMIIKDKILEDVRNFRQTQPQHDDTTLICIMYK